jgi:Beta-L-arabinofuranosidase, GH127
LRSALKQLARLARERPLKRGHRKVLLDDAVRLPGLTHRDLYKFAGTDPTGADSRRHLDATIGWLCRAQDIGGDRGVATAYSFRDGWMASYPETTGYIVETFYDYAELSEDDAFARRAVEMADWLVSIQLEDGAFQAGPVDKAPVPSVFNSGQILLGLVRAQRVSGAGRFLDSARRVGDWLVSVQDADGAWRRFAYRDTPHVYYTRVAWALCELYAITDERRYREAAERQLSWALARQNENGWFHDNSFDLGADPFTHTIVYAAEGLFGAGRVLGRAEYVAAADRVAAPLARRFEIHKFLPGHLDENWQSDAGYTCLTGDAQLAGLLIDLYTAGEADERYLNTALKLNEYVKSTQRLEGVPDFALGGVKGSDPVWGDYLAYSYPNWAAKFFADALLREERAVRRLAAARVAA